jgi:hypothetical protein
LEINRNIADIYSELACSARFEEDLRASDKGLGGDATPVEAGATQFVLLNQSYLRSQVSSMDCCHIAAGAAANYYYILFIQSVNSSASIFFPSTALPQPHSFYRKNRIKTKQLLYGEVLVSFRPYCLGPR